ncbi:MAG: alpha-galactosidase [bacterium]|nr:alpha-galactosidase [bacterium]
MKISIGLNIKINNGLLTITAPEWPGFKIGPSDCRIVVNDKEIHMEGVKSHELKGKNTELIWKSKLTGATIKQTIIQETSNRLRWKSTLTNMGKEQFVFSHVDLLTISDVPESKFEFGSKLSQVRILENRAYRGQVRSIGQIMTGIDGLKALDGTERSFCSEAVTLAYSNHDKKGVLIAFETFSRFKGMIKASAQKIKKEETSSCGFDNVDGASIDSSRISMICPELETEDHFTEASIGFCGADLPIEPGQSIDLEEFVIEIGDDPYLLLEKYAERVAKRYSITDVQKPFANWCSWYSHRLSVTEKDLLENAEIAKARYLDKIGLRFIQTDLGWEKDNIPTYFEENKRFSHGLKWLAKKLMALGFQLGVWTGFTCVSENHPVVKEHPDWLIKDKKGNLKDMGKWFWQPHDRIFTLDATNPDVQGWVRGKIMSLAKRGVRYLKWDFGGNLHTPGSHHNSQIACSNANEGMRIVSRIIHEAMNSQDEKGLVLDCTGRETANLGYVDLLYTNRDTGNTGTGYKYLKEIYAALGTHLFKNQRWGLIQPSCFVVGLPGTLEEARVRATATFLCAGHVDISDNLAILPEDRWQVLLATLPPLQKPAVVVDLFYPVRISLGSYAAMCKGENKDSPSTIEPQGANIWHVPIKSEWDSWHLVAVFNLFEPEKEESGCPVPFRFGVDFKLLGLDSERSYWAYEFWSGQFLGTIPVPLKPKGSYRHPGDFAALVNDSLPGKLDVTFYGPSVKLLVIRRKRSHPWPVGTTFHQSSGLELTKVKWNVRKRTLSGELHRPPGERGSIIIAGLRSQSKVAVTVEDRKALTRITANGAVCIPVVTEDWTTKWQLRELKI